MKVHILNSIILIAALATYSGPKNTPTMKNGGSNFSVVYNQSLSVILKSKPTDQFSENFSILKIFQTEKDEIQLDPIPLQCKPKTVRISKNEVYVVTKDCFVHVYKINPN